MLVHPAQLLLGFSALCGLSNAQVTLLGVVPPEFSSISAEGGCILGTPSFSSLETLQDGQIRYLEEIAVRSGRSDCPRATYRPAHSYLNIPPNTSLAHLPPCQQRL